ncbi:DUF3152 domain-containing protein [Catenuloplanes japonicus]|uniref:DUF3152 domain-containing protein n=1 Tax=Catenuloplanes japonicus TaxID=33876 RepID=UPI00068F0588|nr:DUF3152 domain-containing protein [Catenuloplanes japonicus]
MQTARIAGLLALCLALTACGSSTVPESGSGEFATADGSPDVIGDGEKLITYLVEVETGVDWGDVPRVTPDAFADEITGIWSDPRSWTGSAAHPITAPEHDLFAASWRFQRVSGPDRDVRIRLATPDTVDAHCAATGLDTEGKYSCRFGDTIMINLRRWLEGSPISPSISDYHAGVINHEMGHFLGFGHQGCATPGSLAPVMMQQSIALDGCEPNVWPFTPDGDFVSGPSQI